MPGLSRAGVCDEFVDRFRARKPSEQDQHGTTREDGQCDSHRTDLAVLGAGVPDQRLQGEHRLIGQHGDETRTCAGQHRHDEGA